MSGPLTNTLFAKQLVPRRKHPIRGLFRDMISVGSISYYMNGFLGWKTRIFMHNYLPLLNDAPFDAEWEIEVYKRNGRLANRLGGKLCGPQTKVIEISDIEGVDDFGLVYGHIKAADKTQMMSQQYATVYFSEYYKSNDAAQSIHAHSLGGAPKASHYTFYRLGTGFTTPPGFRPYFFIANSCAFQRFLHSECGGGYINFINHKREKETVVIDRLAPLECRAVDLFENWPHLREHLDNKPYSIEIDDAKNILALPFVFQTDGRSVLAEHI